MKTKLYLFISALLSCTLAIAQPVPTATMPAVNDQYTMYSSSTAVAHTAGSSSSQTWDYSAAAKTAMYTYTWVSYAGLSQAIRDSFPTGTHAVELRISGMAANTEIYQVTSGALLFLGAKGSGSSWNKNYEPRTFFKTPMTLGDSVSYNVYTSVKQTATYDAYGTLKTPFGTFNDVIRMKVTETGNPETFYIFYQCSPTYKKLAHYIYTGTTTKTVYFYQFTSGPSNVSAVNNEQITVYPNPVKAGNEIVVNNLTPESKIELLNMMGETISTTTGANPVFATEALPAGMYLVRVVTENKTSVSKIVVQ